MRKNVKKSIAVALLVIALAVVVGHFANGNGIDPPVGFRTFKTSVIDPPVG